MPNPKFRGFSAGDVRRISSAVRRHERYYRLPPPAQPRGPAPSSGRVVPVVCPSGGIAAGSLASPTNGTGHLAIPNAGGPGLVAGDAITLYNTIATAVPSGSKPGYAAWFGGYYYMLMWGC